MPQPPRRVSNLIALFESASSSNPPIDLPTRRITKLTKPPPALISESRTTVSAGEDRARGSGIRRFTSDPAVALSPVSSREVVGDSRGEARNPNESRLEVKETTVKEVDWRERATSFRPHRPAPSPPSSLPLLPVMTRTRDPSRVKEETNESREKEADSDPFIDTSPVYQLEPPSSLHALFIDPLSQIDDDDDDETPLVESTAAPLYDDLIPSLSRPPLATQSSSTTTISSLSPVEVSPFDLFKSGAQPLILPRLDEYLNLLERPKFTSIDKKGLFSEAEQREWNEWIRGDQATKKRKWLDRFSFKFSPGFRLKRKEKQQSDKYEEIEDQASSTALIASTRSSILPPMHLVPPNITVSDLKRNVHSPAPILTLDTALSIAIDGILGGEGSNYGISLAKVEVFRDLIQMMSLLLHHTTPTSTRLRTTTAFLAGDFVSAFGYALLWLWIFTALAAFFVYEVYRFTGGWDCRKNTTRKEFGEGFDRENLMTEGRAVRIRWWQGRMRWRNARWYKVAMTFAATSMYLPLSRIAIGALVWSDDYWIPTVDLTTAPSTSICYSTSYNSGINWIYIILPVAASTIIWLTLFLPWRLHLVTRLSVPNVDRFTELGESRKDVTAEYTRLLERSTSPFSFLFNDYQRSYSSYKSIYMLVKLINVVLIVILSTSNCLFLNRSAKYTAIIRTACQLVVMTIFLASSLFYQPFIAALSNASDRVSRIAYVLVALFGLLVALDVPGEGILAGPMTTFVEVVSYSFSGYFAIVATGWAQRVIKQVNRRLDLSIDVFSPHLSLSRHIAVRIYQETLSILIFTSPEMRMESDQTLRFSNSHDQVVSTEPPYLLGLRGSVAERHLENLKILRSIGSERYLSGLSAISDDRVSRLHLDLWKYTGPDAVWSRSTTASSFGRLDIIPFPFTCTFRPDDDVHCPSPIFITAVEDLESLLKQNQAREAKERRYIRRALRSLDGQIVSAHYQETKESSGGRQWGFIRREIVSTGITYRHAVLRTTRNSPVTWGEKNYNYSSGFQISLHYSDGEYVDSKGQLITDHRLVLSGVDYGIDDDDYRMTRRLAHFLRSNRTLIDQRLPGIIDLLQTHQDYHRIEAERKALTLSYEFTFNVFANASLSPSDLDRTLKATEWNPVLKNLAPRHHASILYLEERMKLVNRSKAEKFWFLLFDDLWRRNHLDCVLLRQNLSSFSPYYRESICYRVMARGDLEAFLNERGLLPLNGQRRGWFHSGFLNKIYFYLDELIFQETSDSIPIHVNHSPTPTSFATLTPTPQHDRRSTRGAGGTLEHDEPVIRFRSSFPFEALLDQAPRSVSSSHWYNRAWRSLRIRGGEWLGLSNRRRRDIGVGNELVFELRRSKEGWKLPIRSSDYGVLPRVEEEEDREREQEV